MTSVLWLCALGSAHGQATRTWVSGTGDDANPCSRTLPCRTFAGALGKTAASGEIDALDPGEFGALAITKAILIDGHPTLGAARTAGATGITISAGPADTVILRGLSLHGDGTQSGIQFLSGATLDIEDCAIAGFKEGVEFVPALGGHLFLRGVTSRNNADAGLRVGATGSAPSFVTVMGGHLEDNAVGLLAGTGARVDVYDSVASGNSVAGISATLDNTGGMAEINLQGVAVNHNGTGILSAAVAGKAVVRLSQVLGTGNTVAPTSATGNGAILSFGDNRLDLQASLALSSTAPSQQVLRGASASFPLAVAVTGLLMDPISLSCTGLPAGAACQFAPATLPAGQRGGMVTLTLTTSTPVMGLQSDASFSHGWPSVFAPLLLLALALAFALLGSAGRLRRPLRGAAVFVMVMVLYHGGCTGTPMAPGPPDMTGMTGLSPGTHAFQATATSGAISAILPLTLVVQ